MEEKLIEQLKDILEIEDREINIEDEFRSYKEWDSLAYLSVISMIDDEFNVVIETEDFRKIRTVGQLCEEIKARM